MQRTTRQLAMQSAVLATAASWWPTHSLPAAPDLPSEYRHRHGPPGNRRCRLGTTRQTKDGRERGWKKRQRESR